MKKWNQLSFDTAKNVNSPQNYTDQFNNLEYPITGSILISDSQFANRELKIHFRESLLLEFVSANQR